TMVKFRADGSIAWTRTLTNADGQPTALTIDAAGAVYAGGVLNVLKPGLTDAYVYKLAADTGETVWTRDYSSADTNDYPTRLKLDGAGSIYVTGGVNAKFFAAKLNAATGAEVWQDSFAATDFGDDAGLDIAFD